MRKSWTSMLILMLVGVAFASTGFSPRSDEAAKTQQQVPAKGTDFKVIQEIPVTGGSMVMPDMMVKGDGSLGVCGQELPQGFFDPCG